MNDIRVTSPSSFMSTEMGQTVPVERMAMTEANEPGTGADTEALEQEKLEAKMERTVKAETVTKFIAWEG